MDCLNTADEAEVREYESRVQAIASLKEKMDEAKGRLEDTDSQIEELRRQWLTPLQEIVGRINEKFSNAFERMGCAGEVSLYTGMHTHYTSYTLK